MTALAPLFPDRTAAGRDLAQRLSGLRLNDPVIYALPRGGVPLAVEIGRVLNAPVELILVRKIGAPGAPEVALGAVVDGADPQIVINEDVGRLSGADVDYFNRARDRELAEIERRRTLYLGDRTWISPRGRTAIVVDDGLATGATAKAALRALRRQGAAQVVLAVPVAPKRILPQLRREADEVLCLHAAEEFWGVGAFYGDFHQLTDQETLAMLDEARNRGGQAVTRRPVRLDPLGLLGDLQSPRDPQGIVVFAHGSGSSRLSPRNIAVADSLNRRGFATLLIDLLTGPEASVRRNVFDIELLADRVKGAVNWVALQPELASLSIGLFGASTGAAAALRAAADLGPRIAAVVSRGGRPDLAGERALARVVAPTLLIVGAADRAVIDLNRAALYELQCEKALQYVPAAGHLFEEPGALETVMDLAGRWFERWLSKTPEATSAPAHAKPPALTAVGRLRMAAEPLPDLNEPAFAEAFDRFADARVVLLGESTHGTSEFYKARALITQRLIQRHGFDFVAVEADWPDAAAIDRYVRGLPHQPISPPAFSRFPTWMWRNTAVHDFTRWLHEHNAPLQPDRRAAFYGLDLYNMRASMAAVLAYLDKVDSAAATTARRRYECLAPWSTEPAAYGRAALNEGYAICEEPVLSILRDMVGKALDYAQHDGERFFDAAQNARLVANAERYYRAMYYGSHESWNLRDQHMFETLDHVMALRGPSSKAVVWAHNSHIGDARFTDMGASRGELNIGQLCRQRFGQEAALIGFGCYEGTVMAASNWDEPGQVMAVLPARPDSYESLYHQTGIGRFLLDLRPGQNEAVREDLMEPRLERYIGVIYRPQTELMSHYARSCLPRQFDAFVWFDQGQALKPLPKRIEAEEDDTFPFGV